MTIRAVVTVFMVCCLLSAASPACFADVGGAVSAGTVSPPDSTAARPFDERGAPGTDSTAARPADEGEAPGPGSIPGESAPGPDSTAALSIDESSPQPDSASTDSSTAPPARSLLMLPDRYYRTGTTLAFSMHSLKTTERMLGFETYRASRRECALRGAGMGMNIGMAVGAFGMMAGAWDEKETWYIAGAMTALGALYGGLFKADDPKYNLRIRVEPKR